MCVLPHLKTTVWKKEITGGVCPAGHRETGRVAAGGGWPCRLSARVPLCFPRCASAVARPCGERSREPLTRMLPRRLLTPRRFPVSRRRGWARGCAPGGAGDHGGRPAGPGPHALPRSPPVTDAPAPARRPVRLARAVCLRRELLREVRWPPRACSPGANPEQCHRVRGRRSPALKCSPRTVSCGGRGRAPWGCDSEREIVPEVLPCVGASR